jgi:N-acetylglucosamine-6-phosphate deacetylase
MATLYPARAIAIDHCLGQLLAGYQANITLFDPERFTVKGVIDQGVLTWGSGDLEPSLRTT